MLMAFLVDSSRTNYTLSEDGGAQNRHERGSRT